MTTTRITDQQRAGLLEAVRNAGEFLLSLWPGAAGSSADLGVESKADGSLVSRADFGANEILTNAITRLFPGDALLSEETAPDVAALAAAKRTWVIDPLDGTKHFLNGTDQFSVLVALCEDRCPTLGLMLFPARGVLVVAEQGRGVTVNGERASVSRSSAPRPSSVYIRNFESKRPELASPMMDSGLAFLKLITGELDGVVIRMTTHREWDIAAPIVAIREAGGRVTDEAGKEIPCGLGTLQFQYLVASNGSTHSDLLSLIS